MHHNYSKIKNVCWKRKKTIVVLLMLLCILAIFFILNHHQNVSFKNLQFSTKQKTISASLNRYDSSTQNSTQDKWIRFAEGVYGYSAYWDSRIGNSGAFLRVISISDRNPSTLANLRCHVKVENVQDQGVIMFEFIHEHHNKKHAALIINCIPRRTTAVPDEIAIFSTAENTEKHWMPVKKILQRDPSADNKMAVCVRPLFGPFNQTHHLAEFISFYLAIGFSHFVFYDHNVDKEAKNYLVKLSRKISLDLLPWGIPDSIHDAWAFGQLASIQDCIYRYMYIYEYLLFVDLDEYVVPKYRYHLQQTISDFVSKAPTKPFGAFIIRQVFYCVDNASQNSTIVLNNTKRLSVVWPAKMRSKILLKPEAVVISRIHSTEKMFGSWLEVALPAEFVVVHHYRNGVCKNNSRFDWKNSSVIEDKSALKYSAFILNSVPLQVWKGMFLI